MEKQPHNSGDDHERDIPELERLWLGEIDMTGVVRQDDALVDVIGDAIDEAEASGGEVPELGARTLARALANERDDPHSGALHHFAVTGRVDKDAIGSELAVIYASTVDDEVKEWVNWLGTYIVNLPDDERQAVPASSPQDLQPKASRPTAEADSPDTTEPAHESTQEDQPARDSSLPGDRPARSGLAAQRSGWFGRAGQFATAATAAVGLVAGCGTRSSPATTLGHDKATLATCDPQHAPASFVAIDATGSSAGNSLYQERLAAVESVVRTTAICSGYLRVVAFSASSVATTVLYDGSLVQRGATENARLFRVPDAVGSVMSTIKKGYGPAVAGLDARASDILGQYSNAAQWSGQVGGNYQLHLYLLTDGFETAHVNFYTQPPTPADAEALAQQVSLPSLPGAVVVTAGLGREVGPAAPSTVVAGLMTFYNAVCHRTGAAKCVSVSDYEAAGR